MINPPPPPPPSHSVSPYFRFILFSSPFPREARFACPGVIQGNNARACGGVGFIYRWSIELRHPALECGGCDWGMWVPCPHARIPSSWGKTKELLRLSMLLMTLRNKSTIKWFLVRTGAPANSLLPIEREVAHAYIVDSDRARRI